MIWKGKDGHITDYLPAVLRKLREHIRIPYVSEEHNISITLTPGQVGICMDRLNAYRTSGMFSNSSDMRTNYQIDSQKEWGHLLMHVSAHCFTMREFHDRKALVETKECDKFCLCSFSFLVLLVSEEHMYNRD
jgi:hypothetical protein